MGETAILTKVDLRGVGSYLVAPPTLHHSGRRYRWLREPEEGLAEAPGWIGELAVGSREIDGHGERAGPLPGE